MKLIYMWIDKYRNLDDQNFYFSKNEIRYNRSTNTLSIPKISNNQNKTIDEILFDKISVNALAGKNGSGKSSLLECLMLMYFEAKEYNNFQLKLFAIFEDSKNELYIQFTPAWELDEINNLLETKHTTPLKRLNNKDFFTLHYNYAIDDLSSSFKEKILNSKYSGNIYEFKETPNNINLFSQPEKKKSLINITKTDLSAQNYMLKVKRNFKDYEIKDILDDIFSDESNIKFIPTKAKLSFSYNLYIESFENETVQKIIKNYFENENFDNLSLKTLTILTSLFFIFRLYIVLDRSYNLKTEINETNIKNDKIHSLIIGIQNFFNQDNFNSSNIIENNKFIQKVLNYFNKRIYSYKRKLFQDDLGENIKKYFPEIIDAAWYLDYCENKSTKEDYLVNKETISLNEVDNLIHNLPSFINVELWNNQNISYHDLSYGEKLINRFFYNILYFMSYFENKKYKYFNIYIDEIENGLHPEWQQNFFSFLFKISKMLSVKYKNIKIHIILSTHSPFILSDLPKSNIIFMENGINKSRDIHINTFASNIHDLIQEGFFMKNGPIGNFAQKKVNDVLGFLNNKVLEGNEKLAHQDILLIINEIGEDFLRTKLLEMYNSKYNLSNKDRLEVIEKEIQLLQEAKKKYL